MKKSFVVLAVVGCVGLLIGFSGHESKAQVMTIKLQNVVVATPLVQMDKTAKVVLYGTGFAPDQEVLFVFRDSGGVQTVISSDALNPPPKVDESGAGVTAWDCGSYLSLLKPGLLILNVTDGEYKTQAEVPVVFTAPPKKVEKKEEKPK